MALKNKEEEDFGLVEEIHEIRRETLLLYLRGAPEGRVAGTEGRAPPATSELTMSLSQGEFQWLALVWYSGAFHSGDRYRLSGQG